MTYSLMNVAFLGVAAAVALAAAVRARRRRLLGTALAAGGITLLIVLVFTAVFDNVIIGSGLVDYSEAHLIGIRVFLAPVEDFAYTIAAVLLLPSLWLLMRRPA